MRKWLLVLVWLCVTGCSSDGETREDAGGSNEQDGAEPASDDADAGTNRDRSDASADAAPARDAAQSRDAANDARVTQPAAEAGSTPVVGPVQTPGDPGAADVMLAVHADMDLHPISALIYGTNGAPDIARNHQTVVRSGGNRLTAYNWENNASNAGSDWMFQNDDLMSKSNDPAKPILDGIQEASAHGAASIVTIPIVDYVAADKNGGGDVRNSGADYLSKRFKQNKAAKGSAFSSTPDASDAFVYEDEFVAFLKAHVGSAQVLFSLDNEPDLWSSTHAEVHPKAVTYAELWERNQRYAAAIKAAWPGSQVLGPVNYGFNGYANLQNASDANNRDFLEWYLDQAKAAEAQSGRLIDYLDLHWYPEAQGGGTRITDASSAAAVVTAREQAPRSLWDASYNEQSWVRDFLGGPIDLLHRLKKKVDAHYPQTRLAFSEWNYGGGGHISGAIATADVLGIFGREQVGLATYWALSDKEDFAYAAFRAYRNYDGQGAAFGDTSVRASSSDDTNVSVYASIDAAATDHVVIVAINKASSAKSAALSLSHPLLFTKLAVYELSGTTADLQKKADGASSAKNAFRVTLTAQSVTVLVPRP